MAFKPVQGSTNENGGKKSKRDLQGQQFYDALTPTQQDQYKPVFNRALGSGLRGQDAMEVARQHMLTLPDLDEPEVETPAPAKPQMQSPRTGFTIPSLNPNTGKWSGQQVQDFFGLFKRKPESQVTDADRAAAAYQPSGLTGTAYFDSLTPERQEIYRPLFNDALGSGMSATEAMNAAQARMEADDQQSASAARRKILMEEAMPDVNNAMGVEHFNSMDEQDQDTVLNAWEAGGKDYGISSVLEALKGIDTQGKYGWSLTAAGQQDQQQRPFTFAGKKKEPTPYEQMMATRPLSGREDITRQQNQIIEQLKAMGYFSDDPMVQSEQQNLLEQGYDETDAITDPALREQAWELIARYQENAKGLSMAEDSAEYKAWEAERASHQRNLTLPMDQWWEWTNKGLSGFDAEREAEARGTLEQELNGIYGQLDDLGLDFDAFASGDKEGALAAITDPEQQAEARKLLERQSTIEDALRSGSYTEEIRRQVQEEYLASPEGQAAQETMERWNQAKEGALGAAGNYLQQTVEGLKRGMAGGARNMADTLAAMNEEYGLDEGINRFVDLFGFMPGAEQEKAMRGLLGIAPFATSVSGCMGNLIAEQDKTIEQLKQEARGNVYTMLSAAWEEGYFDKYNDVEQIYAVCDFLSDNFFVASGEQLGQQLPSLLIGMATGGASEGGKWLMSAIKNPSFMAIFAGEYTAKRGEWFRNGYTPTAVDKGFLMLESLINSCIELSDGGGVEGFYAGKESFLKSILGEVWEEVRQGGVSDVLDDMSAILQGREAPHPLYSSDYQDDAIINGQKLWETTWKTALTTMGMDAAKVTALAPVGAILRKQASGQSLTQEEQAQVDAARQAINDQQEAQEGQAAFEESVNDPNAALKDAHRVTAMDAEAFAALNQQADQEQAQAEAEEQKPQADQEAELDEEQRAAHQRITEAGQRIAAAREQDAQQFDAAERAAQLVAGAEQAASGQRDQDYIQAAIPADGDVSNLTDDLLQKTAQVLESTGSDPDLLRAIKNEIQSRQQKAGGGAIQMATWPQQTQDSGTAAPSGEAIREELSRRAAGQEGGQDYAGASFDELADQYENSEYFQEQRAKWIEQHKGSSPLDLVLDAARAARENESEDTRKGYYLLNNVSPDGMIRMIGDTLTDADLSQVKDWHLKILADQLAMEPVPGLEAFAERVQAELDSRGMDEKYFADETEGEENSAVIDLVNRYTHRELVEESIARERGEHADNGLNDVDDVVLTDALKNYKRIKAGETTTTAGRTQGGLTGALPGPEPQALNAETPKPEDQEAAALAQAKANAQQNADQAQEEPPRPSFPGMLEATERTPVGTLINSLEEDPENDEYFLQELEQQDLKQANLDELRQLQEILDGRREARARLRQQLNQALAEKEEQERQERPQGETELEREKRLSQRDEEDTQRPQGTEEQPKGTVKEAPENAEEDKRRGTPQENKEGNHGPDSEESEPVSEIPEEQDADEDEGKKYSAVQDTTVRGGTQEQPKGEALEARENAEEDQSRGTPQENKEGSRGAEREESEPVSEIPENQEADTDEGRKYSTVQDTTVRGGTPVQPTGTVQPEENRTTPAQEPASGQERRTGHVGGSGEPENRNAPEVEHEGAMKPGQELNDHPKPQEPVVTPGEEPTPEEPVVNPEETPVNPDEPTPQDETVTPEETPTNPETELTEEDVQLRDENAKKYNFKVNKTQGDGSNDAGVHLTGSGRNVSGAGWVTLQVADRLGKQFGFSVEVGSDIRQDADGKYDGGRTIYINEDAKNPLEQVIGHELYHMVKKISPANAQRIEKIFDRWAAETGFDTARAVEARIAKYDKAGVTLGELEAKEEVIANSMYTFLADENTIRQVYNTDQHLFSRIMDFVNQVQQSIREMLKRYERNTPEARALSRDQKTLEKLNRAMLEALAEMKALDPVKKAATEYQVGNSTTKARHEMTRAYSERMKNATNRAEMNAAARDMAGKIAAKAGGKGTTETDVLNAAAAVGIAGVTPYEAMKNAGLAYDTNDVETKDALRLLGNYMAAVERSGDTEWLTGLLTGEESQENGTKFELNDEVPDVLEMSWKDQVSNYKKFPSNTSLLLGRTPAALVEIGFSNLPMTMKQHHVAQAITGVDRHGKYDKDHHLGEQLLVQLPDLLRYPVAVIASESQPSDSVVVIIDPVINGKKQIAAINVDTKGMINNLEYDVNNVSTTFGKVRMKGEIENILVKAIKNNSDDHKTVFMINSKKAKRLVGEGLQLPNITSSNGFVSSIHDQASPVKTEFIEQVNTHQFKRFFRNSVATENGKAGGAPLVLYHQTENEIYEFDPKHEGSGTSDTETPHGIFLKPTDKDIGLKGKKQLALYARIEHPLTFENRAAAVKWYEEHIDGYAEARKEAGTVDERYHEKYDALEQESDAWYKEHWKEVRAKQISEEEFEKGSKHKEIEELFNEWHEAGLKAAKKAKDILDQYFENSKYDGIHLLQDAGSFGRKIETWIAFKKNQVKSATDNIGTFNPDNPDTRYSIPASMDDEYMDAVESGDEQKQQELADQAAKGAGFDTPRLFHGTGAFGFTEFDLKKGEQLIFATSDRKVAETYSGKTGRSRISERTHINVDDLNGEKLLEAAKKHLQKYSDYHLMTADEKGEEFAPIRAGLKEDWQLARDFVEENKDAFNEKKKQLAEGLVKALEDLYNARTEEEIDSAWGRWDNGLWDLKWMDESICDELMQAVGTHHLLTYKNLLSDMMYDGDMYINAAGEHIFDNQLALELEAELHKGVYELYGRSGRQLVIDGKGNNWNQIEAPEELHLYGPQKTRDIAAAAKAYGYDSVLIKNIYDLADYGYRAASDIYIFFNAEQVKSADPVTYDDQGNVIPLSERFKKDNQDIRYSLPTADEDFDFSSGDEDPADAGEWAYNENVARAGKSKQAYDLLLTLRETKHREKEEQYGNWRQHIGEMARTLVEETGSQAYSQQAVEKELNEIFEAYEQRDGASREDADQAVNEALDMLQELVGRMLVDQVYTDEVKAVRSWMRKGIYLDEEQAKELGGKEERRYFRQVVGVPVYYDRNKAIKARAVHLDGGSWAELNQMAPSAFPMDDDPMAGSYLDRPRLLQEYLMEHESMTVRNDPQLRDFVASYALETLADYYSRSDEGDATSRLREANRKANSKAASLERQLKNSMDEVKKLTEANQELDRRWRNADTETWKAENQLRRAQAENEQLKAQQGTTRPEIRAEREQLQKDLQAALTQQQEAAKALAAAQKEQKRLMDQLERVDERASHLDSTLKAVRKENDQKMKQAIREGKQRWKKQAEQRAENQVNRQNIRKLETRMKKMLEKPSNTGYVPFDMIRKLLDLVEAVQQADTRKTARATESWMRAVREMREETNSLVKDAYDDGFIRQMQEAADILNDKRLRDLNGEELRFVSNTMTQALYQIENATKLVGEDRKADALEEAQNMTETFNAHKPQATGGLAKGLQSLATEHLNPESEFNKLAGYRTDNAVYRRGQALIKGQREMNRIKMEMTKRFEPLMTGKNAKLFERFQGKKAEIIDTGIAGSRHGTFKITQSTRAAIYLHSLNKQNVDGMKNGVTVPDYELMKKGKYREAWDKAERMLLSERDMREITAGMTEYEKAWCKAWKEMQAYITPILNDVSMKLNGWHRFTVENYFPIRRDGNYLATDFESLMSDDRISSMGFAKLRKNASNPMMLEDLYSVVNRTINGSSLYAGMLIPVTNFNKVFNASLPGYEDSPKAALRRVFGNKEYEYIERMMKDVQQAGVRTDSSLLDKVRSKAAPAALGANLSVIIKQAASYPTAAAVLGWRPLMRAMTSSRKFDQSIVDKYTSAYWERTSANIQAMNANTQNNTIDKTSSWLNAPIAGMDKATVRKIWIACEYAVEEQQPGLARGSDAYYEAVAELYEHCLERTQPEYGVMQRSHILRSNNQLTKSLTMYKTQSFQNFNVLYDAVQDFRTQAKAFKSSQSEENRAELDRAKIKLARAASSQIVSAVVLALMTAVGKAVLHKPEPYQDDKGELTAQSAAAQLSKDTISSMMGMVTGGSELFDLITGIIDGKAPYDIEAGAASMVNDLYQSAYKLGVAATAIADSSLTTEQKWQKSQKAVESFLSSVAAMGGIPYNNLRNIKNSAIKYVDDIRSGKGLEGLTTGDVSLSTGAKYMAQALQSGDQETYTRLYNRLISQGKSGSQINSAIKSWVKANDPRIREAADAIDQGDLNTYNSLINQMVGDGYGMAMVVSAIEAVRKAEGGEEAAAGEETGVDQLTYEQIMAAQENESASAYTYAQLNSLLEAGNTSGARKVQSALFKTKGTTGVKSALTSYWKPKYREAYQNRNRTELNRITRLMKAMGYSDASIAKWKNVQADGGSTTMKSKSKFGGSFGSGFSSKKFGK